MRQWNKRGCRGLVGLLIAVLLLTGSVPMARAATPVAPSLKGTGAIVVDFDTDEVYYEKNPDVARPIASMTKVMTLYLVFEELAAGNLTLDSYVTASQYAADVSANPEYSGHEGLVAGGQYQVDTLIRLITTQSCNGSVIVLAEHIGGGSEAAFVQRMNDKAAAWGIDAHFADVCGLVDEGNAVTPRAMAYIAKRIITDYPQILDYTSLTETQFQGKTFRTTNSLLKDETCPGVDGLKTGFTTLAGYCFTGTAQRDGRRIISVVLHTTNASARMSEGKALLEYGFARREEREAQWKTRVKSLELDITAQGPLWSNGETALSAAVKCPAGEVFGSLTWEVDGHALQEPEARWLRDGDVLTLPFKVPQGEDPLSVALTLTLPDGTQLRKETTLARAEGEMPFEGRMGMRRVEIYPEATLTVPFQIRLTAPISVEMTAGWFLDGAPIPGYVNSAFRVGDTLRTSGYTFQGSELTPGLHVLEFRCNAGGLAGIPQLSFTTEILVLDEGAGAVTADGVQGQANAA